MPTPASSAAAIRRDRFITLAEQYWIRVPTPEQETFETSSEEDVAEYLYSDLKIDRWVAVTYHDNIHYLKTFPTRQQAEERSIEYVTDDIFTESPVGIVDLDDPATPYGKLYRLTKLIPVFEGGE